MAEGALDSFSFKPMYLQIVGGIQTDLMEERIVLDIEPGITVVQTVDNQLVFELNFTNDVHSINRTAAIDLDSCLLSSGSNSGSRSTGSNSRTSSEEQSPLSMIAFVFDPESGEASFYCNQKKQEIDLGNLSDYYLAADGVFYINDDVVTCVQLNTELPSRKKNNIKQGSDCKLISKSYA